MSELKNEIKKINLKICIGLVIACQGYHSTAQALTYHIDELPPAAGYDKSYARNINDKGVVVGDSHPLNANYFTAAATVWRSLIPASLGKVTKGNYSYATAINTAGKIAGDSDNGNSRPNVVVYQNGSAQFIGSGANNSHAIYN